MFKSCLMALTTLGLVAAVSTAADKVAPHLFFPGDVDAVVDVDFKKVLDSSIFKKFGSEPLKNMIKDNADLKRVLGSTGIDPMKDIETLTMAVGMKDPADPKAYYVISGKFDMKKLNDTIAAEAKKGNKDELEVIDLDGKPGFKMVSKTSSVPAFGAVIDDNTIVIGTGKEFAANAFKIAKAADAKPLIKKELAELLKAADKNAAVTVVAYLKGRLDELPLPDPNAKKSLEKIETLAINVFTAADVKMEMAFGTAGEGDAKEMTKQLEGAIEQGKALVPVFAGMNPQLKPIGDLLETIKTKTKGNSAVMTMTMTEELIEKAMAALKGN